MVKNLWGDLSSLAVIRTPKTILEEQASLLTEATAGLLVGTVEDAINTAGRFMYSLNVVVPALNNYRYRILTVVYPLEMYPVQFISDRPSINEVFESEEKFESAVAKVLGSPDVKSALSHLKSQIAVR